MAPGPAHRIELQLDHAMPQWRAIAANPNWPRWLNAANPANGQVRREQFNRAIERGDAWIVVEMLQRFQQERREGWPIREVGEARQARAPIQYTRDQIHENYERHRQGAYTGREAEWNRLERDMVAAAREGRVANAVPLAKNFADGR